MAVGSEVRSQTWTILLEISRKYVPTFLVMCDNTGPQVNESQGATIMYWILKFKMEE